MKKIIKRVSYLVTSMVFMICGVCSTLAYDSSIEKEAEIGMPLILYSNGENDIYLYGDLKNDNAKVYQQYVKITKEQFEDIRAKHNGLNNYVTEQNKVIEEKSDAILKEKEALDNMAVPTEYASLDVEEIISSNNSELTITEEQYNQLLATDYGKAYSSYLNNKKEFDTYVATFNTNVDQKEKEFIAAVPSFDNTKWIELKKSKDTASYSVSFPKGLGYSVSWVKVTLDGKDYYNNSIYCEKEAEVKEETPKEETPKEETKTEKTPKEDKTTEKNPKTGVTTYYTYIVLITLIASSSYILVRKMKKFSR